jgi:hypothetical protein
MKRLRALLTRLKARPPTGPLTTREQTTADELQAETRSKDSDRIAREEKAKGAGSDDDV